MSSSSSSSINKSVNVERRTWDKESFEARARSRAAAAASAASAIVVGNEISQSPTTDPIVVGGVGVGGGAADSIKKELLGPTEEVKEEFVPAQRGRAGPMGSQRAYLKARTGRVDLEGKLGSTEIIDPAAASATRSRLRTDDDDNFLTTKKKDGAAATAMSHASGVSKCVDGVGWHCRVCDCFLKDSLTYLDHINGKKHQRYLGYTMRVEKSTTEEVSGVLKGLAEKKQQGGSSSSGGGGGGGSRSATSGDIGDGIASESLDFEDLVRKKDEEALRRKADRVRKREERRRKEREEKMNNGTIQVDYTGQNNNNNHRDCQEGAAPGGDDDPAEDDGVEGVDEEEEVEGIDPNIAAMMGFSGFSGRIK